MLKILVLIILYGVVVLPFASFEGKAIHFGMRGGKRV